MGTNNGARALDATQQALVVAETIEEPGSKAVALALLAVEARLDDIAAVARSVDHRLEQLNQYLGAIANKP
ncbi:MULTISPECIES: hypothetical protein [Streptomyces]|uniref:ANTAR domain-containing protein n=1 Tax=Streptomyces silvisoli TaxID=3034235 RepID=A0ABT5ZIY6_9ACTN|nr:MULTISPECIES: hypothetical protein [Streptomyces]MDF3289797.1 hypothetical protein [Streptomyces silvisoli]